MQYQVFIKSIPACQVLSLRRVLPDYYAEGLLWKEMSRFAQENRIQVSSDTFSIYHDREYKETDVDVEICAPVKKPGKSTEDSSSALQNQSLPWHVQWFTARFPTSPAPTSPLRTGCRKTSASKWQGKADRLSTAAHGTKRTPKTI